MKGKGAGKVPLLLFFTEDCQDVEIYLDEMVMPENSDLIGRWTCGCF